MCRCGYLWYRVVLCGCRIEGKEVSRVLYGICLGLVPNGEIGCVCVRACVRHTSVSCDTGIP